MSMTVRRLITALKKMPPDAKIAICCHDQNPEAGEFNGSPWKVERAPLMLKDRGLDVVIFQ